MRLTGSGTYSRPAPVPRMPPGLVELMENLTKDVLRNNPTNIFVFCANHMEKLIEIRDGPSRKKSLSLEEKIALAQKKVRQRAKERQQQYDSENMLSATMEPEKDEFDRLAPNASQQELLPDLRVPIRHEEGLSLDSEVEISHEQSTDSSLASKDSNIEVDEIPISKSSTVSSISKSTVIDLLNNDQEIINKEDIEDDNGPNQMNEGDAQNDTLAINKNSNETSIKEYQSPMSDVIDQNLLIETTFVPEEISAKEPNVYLKKEIENKIDTLEKFKSDNQIVDSGTVESYMTTAIVESESSPQHKTSNVALVDTKILTDSISSELTKTYMDMEGTIKSEVTMESTSYVTNEQPANIQMTEVEDLSPAKTECLKDSSLPEPDDNRISHVQSPAEIRTDISATNENTIQAVNDLNAATTAEIVYEQSTTIEIAKIHEEIDKETEATPDFTISTSKENDNGVDIKNIKIDSTGNINILTKEDIKHSTNEDNIINKNRRESMGNDNTEKSHEILNDDIEEKYRPTENESKDENKTLMSKPDSVDKAGSNTVETDLSKAEDDGPQNDNENIQNNMDLETAVVTIQKVFRSFLFKSRNSTFEDITNDEAISLDEDNDKKEEYYAAADAANISQDRRPLGLTRMDTVLQTVNEEKSLSLSTDDSSTLSSAATTIQAHVRGFLVRNRLNSYKTVSTNSLVNSNEMLDTDSDQKSKTVLNIHIVPEQANYLSRDESLITSIDLSLDGSPPSSVNLHPLSYDLVSERRKLLKREDAIQSVSPPSNNSGKLSEDSVKDVNENDATKIDSNLNEKEVQPNDNSGSVLTGDVTVDDTSKEPVDVEIIVEKRKCPMSPDESDVVTPFVASPHSVGDFENTSRLLHSGEFHDVLLPTKVSRSDTTVVREFTNVLAYILLWNAS